jgi:GNAT superfamily N-acetyltransferase
MTPPSKNRRGPTPLLIRRATERDARAISDLIRRNAEAILAREYTIEQMAAWRRYNTPARLRRRIAERVTFGAFRGRRLCGTVAFEKGELQGLYVSPRCCGRGIGRFLLAHLEAFAASRGSRRLNLTSTPGAVAFYAANGWRAERKMAVDILGVRFDETLMTKRLPYRRKPT